MAKLSEILSNYGAILLDVDAADGELTADIAERLTACEDSLSEKVEGIERLCESLSATAKAVRERAARSVEHARALEARAERIHAWALSQLEAAGLEKFEAGEYRLSRRVNPPRLDIVDDAALREWLRENHPTMIRVVEEVEKKSVLDLAKAGPVPGVMVCRGHHWRVS